MAIAENQLKVHQMVESSKDDFNNVSDDSRKETAKEEKTETKKKTSLFDKLNKPHVIDMNIGKANGGIFSNILCCKLPSLNLRLPKYKLNFNRKLKFNFSLKFKLSICGKEKKINPFDTAMNVANIIKKNPGLLSGDSKTRLQALLRSDILAKMNILGLGATVPTCILGKTIGSLYGSDTGLGPSLRSRNSLRTLLYQDPCTAMFANQPLVNKWLSNSSAAALISTIISADKNKAYSFVDLALGITGQRESALGSLIGALAYSYDYNTRNKLDVINRVVNSGKLTGRDFIYLKANIPNVLKDLDGEKEEKDVKSADPDFDFNKYLNLFNKLDPSWNSGNNFHATAGNKTFTELSNSKLKNKHGVIDLTGNYTTTLEPEHHIAIINKFNKTICTC